MRQSILIIIVMSILVLAPALAFTTEAGSTAPYWWMTGVKEITPYNMTVEEWQEKSIGCVDYYKLERYYYYFEVKPVPNASVLISPTLKADGTGGTATAVLEILGNGTVRFIDIYTVLAAGDTGIRVNGIARVEVIVENKWMQRDCVNDERDMAGPWPSTVSYIVNGKFVRTVKVTPLPPSPTVKIAIVNYGQTAIVEDPIVYAGPPPADYSNSSQAHATQPAPAIPSQDEPPVVAGMAAVALLLLALAARRG